MAAGSGAASGHGARSSTAALEASLDRRFQGVSNTMESIQGLSTWCIENKKHHGLIVRHWMKWLKKSDNNHRLNLFYLANDVIQNCKRKNAIVFRSAFAEVLPNAAQLIKDGKVRKSVERIFTIWEERSVYPEEVISQFKASMNKKEKEREKQKEKEKEKEKEREKEKEKEAPIANAPTNTKAALKSKIVAEFTPHSLIEQLSRHKRAVAEEEFREKQVAALRVDVCSTEALKRLKDKAEGNKFAKDFEEGSLKLQEFVSFLDKELKTGPPLLEALGNADIFYETQYKEVKIVANAYNAFANRVASLKRKLDSLKGTLPGPEDSPIPSPSEDAPSPTGSDSPFLGLGASRAQVDPELDGKAMDEGELPSDNRDMEDMDMSDEEADALTAGDDKKDKISKTAKSDAALKPPITPTKNLKINSTAATPTPVTPTSATAQSTPTTPLGVNLEKVDLGKISSILSSLTSAMKNTVSPARPTPGTPTTPSGQSAASKVTPSSPALASILSRVDITPEGILNALSKTNTPGLSSLLQSVTNTTSAPPTRTSPESSAVKTLLSPTAPKPKPTLGNSLKRDTPGRTRDWEKERQLSPPPPPPPRPSAPSVSPPSLESKINSFLQGNPGFSLALGEVSPDGVDGTPVRDEAAGTPTQDEIMDTPGSVPESLGSSGGLNLSPTAYRSEPWDAVITPSGSSNNNNGDFMSSSSSSRYGAGKKSGAKSKDDEVMNMRKHISSSPTNDMKGKKDGQQLKMMGSSRGIGSRKTSSSSDDGGASGKREDKGKGEETPLVGGKEGQYHRIETLVSPCTEGAPIQTLGYSNRPLTGERIKTVESIRVIGRGCRRGGGAGGRPGGAMWYEEEEYMEAQPPSPHDLPPPPPRNISQGGTEDMTNPNPSMPPPPPSHLLLPHLQPPPSHPHSHPPPQAPFQIPYHTENMQTPPPSLLHQHPPPTSPFFGAPPPIPRPPPPPVPQRPSPPPAHPIVPSAVMVGGVLVPVDRPISLPPPVRPDGVDRGGMGPRGSKVGPPPLMTSLLGEPPKLPRPGTIKEPFVSRHPSPLLRPVTPGVPLPLLGRVKEPLNLPLPPPSPTSSTPSPSTPNSPAVDTVPARLPAQSAAPPLHKPPSSPPPQPRNQTSNPVPLLNLPTPRPPILSAPIPQRPLLRGRNPSQHHNRDHHMGGFRGGKRHGPPFIGGPFHGQKRPYLPPRY